MKKNILFYFAWQLNPVHFGIVIEKLESMIAEQKNGGKIVFLFCDGSLKPCYTNREANPSLCEICTFNSAVGLNKFKDQVDLVRLSEYTSNLTYENKFSYNSIDDIKKITYKEVKIGYGALSSYISFTRNLEPIMDSDFRNYFDRLLESQLKLTDSLLEIIAKESINECYFFNGRTADTRPMYDICVTRKIPFISLEMIKKSEDEFYINEFTNCLPHDIDFHNYRIGKQWENTDDTLENKIAAGSNFFENRKKGMLVREKTVFTAGQEHGLLPEGYDPEKKNISIFISSEDEFASIGDVFEKLALFKTQQQGLEIILEEFTKEENYHFYIRIHPNLRGIQYSYHTRLMNLQQKYANATVIAADSKVSTYALLDASDVVVVFGSTTGVEACYWDKPVILLAGAFYYYLDVSYKPDSKEALFLLLRQQLVPKSKLDAIKYGYYMVNYQKFTRKNRFSPFPITLFGKKIGLGHHHLKVFGSSLLFRIKEKALYAMMNSKTSKKLTIPRKGM